MVQGIYLEPFPSSSQEVLEGNPVDFKTATPEEILKGIQQLVDLQKTKTDKAESDVSENSNLEGANVRKLRK